MLLHMWYASTKEKGNTFSSDWWCHMILIWDSLRHLPLEKFIGDFTLNILNLYELSS